MVGIGHRYPSVLLSEPDQLLLDAPTNHLDAESVEWLEKHLADYKRAVLADAASKCAAALPQRRQPR